MTPFFSVGLILCVVSFSVSFPNYICFSCNKRNSSEAHFQSRPLLRSCKVFFIAHQMSHTPELWPATPPQSGRSMCFQPVPFCCHIWSHAPAKVTYLLFLSNSQYPFCLLTWMPSFSSSILWGLSLTFPDALQSKKITLSNSHSPWSSLLSFHHYVFCSFLGSLRIEIIFCAYLKVYDGACNYLLLTLHVLFLKCQETILIALVDYFLKFFWYTFLDYKVIKSAFYWWCHACRILYTLQVLFWNAYKNTFEEIKVQLDLNFSKAE